MKELKPVAWADHFEFSMFIEEAESYCFLAEEKQGTDDIPLTILTPELAELVEAAVGFINPEPFAAIDAARRLYAAVKAWEASEK